MNKKELKQKYYSDFCELRKIINSWDLIPEAQCDEFDSLTNKVLSHLYKNSDYEKILKAISSELVVYYGLFRSEFDGEKFTKEIFDWWENK